MSVQTSQQEDPPHHVMSHVHLPMPGHERLEECSHRLLVLRRIAAGGGGVLLVTKVGHQFLPRHPHLVAAPPLLSVRVVLGLQEFIPEAPHLIVLAVGFGGEAASCCVLEAMLYRAFLRLVPLDLGITPLDPRLAQHLGVRMVRWGQNSVSKLHFNHCTLKCLPFGRFLTKMSSDFCTRYL
jgi:hypothetical protein